MSLCWTLGAAYTPDEYNQFPEKTVTYTGESAHLCSRHPNRGISSRKQVAYDMFLVPQELQAL